MVTHFAENECLFPRPIKLLGLLITGAHNYLNTIFFITYESYMPPCIVCKSFKGLKIHKFDGLKMEVVLTFIFRNFVIFVKQRAFLYQEHQHFMVKTTVYLISSFATG